MKIGNFILKNPEKIERALHGSPVAGGVVGGIVDKDGKYKDNDLLVAYDKLAGYITNLKGDKVLNGSFYDIKNKKAFDKPKVSYVFRIPGAGQVVVKEGDDAPKVLEAVKIVQRRNNEMAQ